MDLRALALLAFALAVISLSEEKPVSLTYRCPCRFYESNVARANIKHLKILSTPNCSLQIVLDPSIVNISDEMAKTAQWKALSMSTENAKVTRANLSPEKPESVKINVEDSPVVKYVDAETSL